MTTLEIVDLPADRLPGAVLAVPLFEDQRPLDGPAAVVDWRLDGTVTRMILAGELTGRTGERLAIRTNAKFVAPWALFVGGGRWQALDCQGYAALVDSLFKVAAKAGFDELALCLPPHEGVAPADLERMARSAVFGTSQPRHCRLSRIARFC